MARYRTKPCEIEAFQYDGDMINLIRTSYVPEWAIKALNENTMYYDGPELYIRTLEGNHHASVGDYIIKGLKGELYPCKPDVFHKKYELVE